MRSVEAMDSVWDSEVVQVEGDFPVEVAEEWEVEKVVAMAEEV